MIDERLGANSCLVGFWLRLYIRPVRSALRLRNAQLRCTILELYSWPEQTTAFR